jgi:cysteine desulfurase family protein (TIGR01976 family)
MNASKRTVKTAVAVGKPAADAFPIETIRDLFPALQASAPFIYFDNAAGAQAPKSVLERVASHLLNFNVQRGGRYAKSVEVDRVIAEAREKVAFLLNAYGPEEVAFGLNATSFIRTVSLAIGQTLTRKRDEIVLTDMDHDANVATWLQLERAGARFIWWRMREDRKLYVEDLIPLLNSKTRLVACTAASHAMGTLVDVKAAAAAARSVGAELFLDCVHYTPHALIDVQDWGCDYLVCSGYKAFAPHMGFLWGRWEKLNALPFFREDFIPDVAPSKIEAGTFVFENVAGMAEAVDYLIALGGLVAGVPRSKPRAGIIAAMGVIRRYEQDLSRAMLKVLNECGAEIYGVSDPAQAAERVPTFCFNLPGKHPAAVVEVMAGAGIGIRDGHMFAPRLMARLGLSMDRGAVRASLVHYNTLKDVKRFRATLQKIVAGPEGKQ